MSAITLLIAESSDSFSAQLTSVFKNRTDFNIVGRCKSGLKLIEMVNKLRPQVVLMNIVLEEMDGITALRRMQNMTSSTAFIICAELYNDVCVRLAHRYEARYFLCRPYMNDTLPDCIIDCVNAGDISVSSEPVGSETERAISECLMLHGISTACEGFLLLKQAVREVISDSTLLKSMSKSLYTLLADDRSSSASRVERNIRTAINSAYSRGMTTHWSTKPTNRDFITEIARQVTSKLHTIYQHRVFSVNKNHKTFSYMTQNARHML